ncbi:MAG: type II toxin-antitoxin system VapC family toxin [Nitrospirae bacterium]|nr:type II toxin-antitoxin system VapC family toxin [Nitrospirota bacterium]
MEYVIDASVAIKWYLPEEHSIHAARLPHLAVSLHCPDLLFAETGNILWKYVLRSECTHGKAVTILKELQALSIKVWDTSQLAVEAFDIACRTKRSFYDSLYVALAVNKDCRLVTADLKLYNALKQTTFKKHILWIEDIP